MWKEFETYYALDAPQGSKEWLDGRNYRVTASKCGVLNGSERYDTPDSYLMKICGLVPPDPVNHHMIRGTMMEPHIRRWFIETYELKVEEVGLCVPKWNPYIGGSPDGLLADGEGMIEIKCPERMPDMNRINTEHFDQMQLCMAILGRSYCMYIVACIGERQIYTERVPFNREYFALTLYPAIQSFIRSKLRPMLAKLNRSPLYPIELIT